MAQDNRRYIKEIASAAALTVAGMAADGVFGNLLSGGSRGKNKSATAASVRPKTVQHITTTVVPSRSVRKKKNRRARQRSGQLGNPIGIQPLNSTSLKPYFRMGGRPLGFTDARGGEAMRVSGTVLLPWGLYNDGTTTKAIQNPSSLSSAVYWISLLPSMLGSRFANQAQLYASMAIRNLKITVVPTVSPTGNAAPYTTAIAISQDVATQFVVSTPTQQQIMDYGHSSCLSPTWQSCSMQLSYNGPKVWPTGSGGGQEQSDKYQIEFVGAYNSPITGSTGQIAQFWCEYVVDLYEPTMIRPNLTLVPENWDDDEERKTSAETQTDQAETPRARQSSLAASEYSHLSELSQQRPRPSRIPIPHTRFS